MCSRLFLTAGVFRRYLSASVLFVVAASLVPGCSRPETDARRAGRYAARSAAYREAARQLYERALASEEGAGKQVEIRLALAQLCMDSGDYAAAIETLRPLDSKKTGPLLAVALFKNSDFTGALEAFKRAGQEGDAAYRYHYGLTLEKNNLYDEALRLYASVAGDPFFEAKAKERIAAINLLSPQAAFAGVDAATEKIIQASPSQKDFPDAAGLYLLTEDSIVLTDDRRLVTDSHYVIKVLNDRGKEKFAEVVLTYDSTYEKLDLEYARTIKPDGTVVTVGDKNIRDVSLYLNFPLYSNARARIISMPEVVPGCVIEYKARLVRSELANKKDFDTVYWLQSDEPIVLQRCAVSIPKDRNLRYKIVNAEYNTFGFDMNPRVREEGDRRIFTLEFSNVPQMIPEPLMPPVPRANPYVLFSTFESWEDIFAWWRSLYQDKIAPDAEIRAKAEALTRDKKTAQEKIRAVYNFCAQHIRYVAVEYGDAGYEPHKAEEIFKNKYGDCKDKTVLLIAMLGAVGIEAYPVLISTGDSYEVERDLPALLFNHAIAAVETGGQLVFMDPTGETVSFLDLPPGDEDRTVLVFRVDSHSLLKTPLFGPEHNRTKTSMTIRFNPDEGISAERRVATEGAYQQAQRYWLKFTMPALIEEGLKQKARSIAPQAVLTTHEVRNAEDLDQAVVLAYSFSAPEYFVRAGGDRIMDQFGDIDTASVVREKRRYPIEHGILHTEEETIEVELPAHLEVKYVPQPVVATNRWFDIDSRYDVEAGRLIRWRWVSRLKEKVIPVAEYGHYKKAVEEVASLLNQHVVLKEK